MKKSSAHIYNINRALKNIKSEIIADFICLDNKGIIITTNNVASMLDLQTIKMYITNINNIELNHVEVPRLPQSKSYLKIISIPFFLEDTNTPISSNVVKKIIKKNHILNDIILASRLRFINVSPKSDMSIIWINIWDVQSGSKTKGFINRCFNIGIFIAIIHRANMNLGIPQCKNCRNWGHTMGFCRIQGSKYVKCNRSQMLEHHQQFGWCCKVNSKINPPWLETKKEEPCPHMFKCVNYKSDHQANPNVCPFWKHCFNKE